MTNPRRSILVFTFALGLICAIGCTKRTPVEEISVAESNVVVAESRASELELAWPEWRGGTQGIATAEVPTNWGGSENIRWEASVPGRGHSSPIVVGNSVILGSAIESKEEQLVLAYDRETGDEQWRCVVHSGGFPAKKEVHQKATNANVTVASDGNALVTANFNDGRIWVSGLDLQGNILWQRDVGAFNSKFGYAPSPIIYKSLAIVAADNRGGGYLAGIEIQTGEIAWRRARGDASSYSSPTIVTSDGQAQVVITGGDRMASYSPENGELLWETECISEATCGTVVAAGDRIYASGGYPDRETICLSSTGEKIWSSRTKIYEPSLITDGGNVFAVSDDGIAYCWSGDDGSVLWNKRLGGNFSSSPVISNGNLIVADLSGNQYVLKATGDGFEQVARNRYGDDCYASPAIAGDAIFFRLGFGSGKDRKEKLVCVGS